MYQENAEVFLYKANFKLGKSMATGKWNTIVSMQTFQLIVGLTLSKYIKSFLNPQFPN